MSSALAAIASALVFSASAAAASFAPPSVEDAASPSVTAPTRPADTSPAPASPRPADASPAPASQRSPDASALLDPSSPVDPSSLAQSARLRLEHIARPTGPDALDVVLGCGLRLIAAQDDTLPVAAVVLAIETGSADDPPELPGLVHALAYHLLEGNRELSPGASMRVVHDAGGYASLATSAGQVRFESIVPLPLLPEILRIEAQRLRAPTLQKVRWENALTWASRDPPLRRPLSAGVLAEIHRTPGLGHDGRAVTQALLKVPLEKVGQTLAQQFRYARATLVVVAPQDPIATLATVQGLVSDLPAAPRIRSQRSSPAPQSDAAPRVLALEGGTGDLFAWSLAPTPGALLVARVLCRALNRQSPATGDGKHKQLRCILDQDPRYPTLIVQILGSEDPQAVLEARVARLGATLEKQRRIVEQEIQRETDRPLPLAQQLSIAADPAPDVAGGPRALETLTGLASISASAFANPAVLAHALDVGRAVRLMPPPAPPSDTAP